MSRQPAQDDEAAVTIHRWTCPICGKASLVLAEGEEPQEMVRNALESHIRSAVGGGHGDGNSFPAGFDSSSVTAYIEVETRPVDEPSATHVDDERR